MALPVAVQLYTLREEMKVDMRATLEKVKALGYEGVEFAGLFGKTGEEVRDMCQEIGLVPLSAHVPYVDMVEDITILETYKTIGCKYVVVPYLKEEHRPGTDAFAEVIENIKKIGAAANELGLTLLYHNHDFEFIKLDGKYALDILYEEVNATLLQTELDTCWVNVGGENPSDYVRKYAGRAPIVHLKDFVGAKSANMYELIGDSTAKADAAPEKFDFRPVGYGKQDIPAILAAAKDAGAAWVVVEQDSPSMGLDEMACAQKSIEYLKSLNW